MAIPIKHKSYVTANPGASDLVVGEIAINFTEGGVFTKLMVERVVQDQRPCCRWCAFL